MGNGAISHSTVSIYSNPMARPITGQTPIKERIAKHREKLALSGGRRIIVDLPAEGAAALEKIQERDGGSITNSVTEALIKHAKAKKK